VEHFVSHNRVMNVTVPPRHLVIVIPPDELRMEQMLRSAIRYPTHAQEMWRTAVVTEIEMVLLCNAPISDGEH
jgi:hypothetical protein